MEDVKKKAPPKTNESSKKSMKTFDIVAEAINTIGLPRKGASFIGIKKFASENYENSNRQINSLKVAVKKGLESGALVRPLQCKNSTGVHGSFLLAKVPQKKPKALAKKQNMPEKVAEVSEKKPKAAKTKPETLEKQSKKPKIKPDGPEKTSKAPKAKPDVPEKTSKAPKAKPEVSEKKSKALKAKAGVSEKKSKAPKAEDVSEKKPKAPKAKEVVLEKKPKASHSKKVSKKKPQDSKLESEASEGESKVVKKQTRVTEKKVPKQNAELSLSEEEPQSPEIKSKVPFKKPKATRKNKKQDEPIVHVTPEAQTKVKTVMRAERQANVSKQDSSDYPDTPKISKLPNKRNLSARVLSTPEPKNATKLKPVRQSLLITSSKKILSKYAKMRKQKILANSTMTLEPRKTVSGKSKKTLVEDEKTDANEPKTKSEESVSVKAKKAAKPKKTVKPKTSKAEKTVFHEATRSLPNDSLKNSRKYSTPVMPKLQELADPDYDVSSIGQTPVKIVFSDGDTADSDVESLAKEKELVMGQTFSFSDTEVASAITTVVLAKKKKLVKKQKKNLSTTDVGSVHPDATLTTKEKKTGKGQKKKVLVDAEDPVGPVNSDSVLLGEKKRTRGHKRDTTKT